MTIMENHEKARLKFITYLKKTAEEASKANGGKYQKYSDEDLADACFIFTEILVAKAFDEHSDDFEDLMAIAEEAPKTLFAYIKAVTGVDVSDPVSKKALAAMNGTS